MMQLEEEAPSTGLAVFIYMFLFWAKLSNQHCRFVAESITNILLKFIVTFKIFLRFYPDLPSSCDYSRGWIYF